MPLSPPSSREHIHSREIRCRGFRRADGLWDIEAVLEDTKTYSFANHDRGGIVSGEPIHRMHIRLTLDDALVVQAAEAFTEAAPFSLCGDIAPTFGSLVGLRIGPGWRKAVLGRMAGVHGCTHLSEMLAGMPTAAFQSFAGEMKEEQDDGSKPFQLDQCHALETTTETVRIWYPKWFKGKAA